MIAVVSTLAVAPPSAQAAARCAPSAPSKFRSGVPWVSAFPDDSDPAWSPDSRTIAFARSWGVKARRDYVEGTGQRLYLVDPATSTTRALTPCRGGAALDYPGPLWTPAGDELAWEDLFVTPAGATSPGWIDDCYACTLAWSFDGSWLLEEGYDIEFASRVWLVDRATGTPHELANASYADWSPVDLRFAHTGLEYGDDEDESFTTEPPGATDVHLGTGRPVWAPDGSHVLLRGPASAVVDPDGTNKHVLPLSADARWSPTSAFVAGTGAGRTLMAVKPDGSGAMSLGTLRFSKLNVWAWAPDGSQLAAIGVNGRLFVVAPDGTGRRDLGPAPATASLSWSPAGGRVLLAPRSGSLVLAEADGSRRRTLGTFPGNATWAPDGTAILVSRDETLELVPIDHPGRARILTRTAYGLDFAWAPDGHALAFVAGTWCPGVHLFTLAAMRTRTVSNDCELRGTARSDVLRVTARRRALLGLGGGDRLEGGLDPDVLVGGTGNDRLAGRAGGDYLLGEAGADVLDGGDGWDWLRGGDGNDVVRGGPGKDFLGGGDGDDVLTGGPGPDEFNCGPGFDVAYVQRGEYAQHCERLIRVG